MVVGSLAGGILPAEDPEHNRKISTVTLDTNGDGQIDRLEQQVTTMDGSGVFATVTMDALANTGTITAKGMTLTGELVFDFAKAEQRLTKRRNVDGVVVKAETQPLTLKQGTARAIYSGFSFYALHQAKIERQIVVGDLFLDQENKIVGIATTYLFNITPILFAKAAPTEEATAALNAPIHILPYSVPKAMPLGKGEEFYFLVFDSDGEVSAVEVAFGDGSVEKAANLGQALFYVRHTYRQEGEFSVQVKAKDSQGREYDREFKVRVARGAETARSGVGEAGAEGMEPLGSPGCPI